MPTEVIMPKVDMDMSVGMISTWHAEDGQRVGKSEPLFDIETDKASMEIESPAAGILRLAELPVGTSIPIGQAVAWIYADGEEPAELPKIQIESTDQPNPKESYASVKTNTRGPRVATGETPHDRPRASPLARRLAREHGIQLEAVAGSGPLSRITRQDVESAISERIHVAPDSAKPVDSEVAMREGAVLAGTASFRGRVRLETAMRLSEANRLVPHLHLAFDICPRKLLELRNELNLLRSNRETMLEPVDFVLKAAAVAFQTNPNCNVVWDGNGIRKLGGFDLALVIPAFGGQFTPVIREVERMTITDIATARAGLQARAMSGEIDREGCDGGAAAILDMNRAEAVEATPTIETPRSTMLTIGSIQSLLRSDRIEHSVVSDSVRMTLSADNRAINAETAAAYLCTLKSLLESPSAMLAF